MSTPVLFLDDASSHTAAVDRARAEQTARTLLATLKRLRKINSRLSLNTARPIAQYNIAPDWTLQAILGGTAFKEEWDFIRGLSDRSPFSAGLAEGILQEIESMELRTTPGRFLSSALAWAKLVDSATVSFDALPDWSNAFVEATYCELDDEGSLLEAECRVRNVSKTEHAEDHTDWLTRFGFLEVPTAAKIWHEKNERFPGLRFLARVEKDLAALDGSGIPFIQAVASLEALNDDVANWKTDDTWPSFSRKATPEGERRKGLCWTHDDVTGTDELFDWHTRFTGSFPGRVHFRVDGTNRSIVVGYIGGKLTRSISS